MDMDNNYDAFDNYAMTFDLNEINLAFKYNHTYRVVKECKNICKSLNLDEEDTYICELIGLLHDIGRFYQWSEFKTFSDGEYFDHADYAVKLLFEDNLIKDYDIQEQYYEIIKKAIKNHNKYKIDNCDEIQEFFSKIIKDADKLDILYSFSNPKLRDLDDNDDEIRKEIKDEFYNHKLINKMKKLNCNERIIVKIAFVYDLNFDYSKEKVLKEKYLDNLYKRLKNKQMFKEYIDEAKKYLKGSDK